MPGSFSPRPRRAASGLEGPLQQRARQRDAAGMTSQYTYLYTPQQMADWLEWYRDTLRDGRRWFAHSLPGRDGMVPRVVRYRTAQQQLLGAGIYRVSASFEQRGASLMPAEQAPGPDDVLLLHYQGDYVDVKGHAINVTGSPGFSSLPDGPVLTGAHSWFGGGTATAGGGPARLYTDFSTDFDLNATDFTIQQWSYVPSPNSRPRAFLSIADDSDGPSGNGRTEYFIGIPSGAPFVNPAGALFPIGDNSSEVLSLADLTFGVWQHSFFQRRGDLYHWGLAGVVRAAAINSYRRGAGPKRIFIGQSALTLDIDGFYGYLAESRVTRAALFSGLTPGQPYAIPPYPFADF